MAQPFVGEIRVGGFNFAPKGWALCDGQLMSISQNTALFSLLGTFYGGNGTSNFALPNLQGRVPIGMGQGPGLQNYDIGQNGGEEGVSLSIFQMAQHRHFVNAAGNASSSDPTGNYPGITTQNVYGVGAAATHSSSSVALTGGAQPHENRQPYQVVNFFIALFGIYPSR